MASSTLFDAIRNDDAGLLSAALDEDAAACLQARDAADGRTALLVAAEHGALRCATLLLERDADVAAADVAGRTALLIAAAEGRVELLSLLLARDGVNRQATTVSGNTALHRAAAYGHVAAIGALLEAGADVNATNGDGATPLARAARWGHDRAVAALLAAGADAGAADANGRTPLDWAREKGFTTVADVLAPPPKPAASAVPASPAAKALPPASPLGVAGAPPPPPPTMHNRGRLHSQDGGRGGDDSELLDLASGVAAASSSGGDGGDGEAAHLASGSGGEGDGGGAGGGGIPMRVEGWMAKQGHIFRNWKNRWFVLDGRNVFYYAKEGASKARGAIRMVDGTDVIVEERYAKPFCFTIVTPNKRFVLQAADEDEMAEWLEAIHNNLEVLPYTEADVAGMLPEALAGVEDD